MSRLKIIDSHTEGQPTRLIVAGGPDLGAGTVAERAERFAREFDNVRSAVVCEPRGSQFLVGGLVCEPHDPSCTAGVIFFNAVTVFGMCGHGTIGLVATLMHMGLIRPGPHRIETRVGIVEVELHDDGSVTVESVPAYRTRKGVTVDVPGHGKITGDVVWSGNWFFVVDHGQPLHQAPTEAMLNLGWEIRWALETRGVRGDDGSVINYVGLFSSSPTADSRNFLVCPGKVYDRSPCGTGTCARVACLAADGELREGAVWRQEGILGTHFDAWYRRDGDRIIPSIRGRAHVNMEATLVLSDQDPFCWGIL
jgi:4-hydroxyproline epimerase